MFAGETFDVLLAQSVFTHLLPEHIRECFAHVGKIMKPDSIFYFTYFESPEPDQRMWKTFSYPAALFEEMTAGAFELTRFPPTAYPHPRGQSMMAARRRG